MSYFYDGKESQIDDLLNENEIGRDLVLLLELASDHLSEEYIKACKETQPLLDAFEASKYIDLSILDLPIDACKLLDEVRVTDMQDEVGKHIGSIIKESCQRSEQVLHNTKIRTKLKPTSTLDAAADRLSESSAWATVSAYDKKKRKFTPLSKEAQDARKPRPPEFLVGALQDKVHVDVGSCRPGRTVRIKHKFEEDK